LLKEAVRGLVESQRNPLKDARVYSGHESASRGRGSANGENADRGCGSVVEAVKVRGSCEIVLCDGCNINSQPRLS
jgi:hypothetical protein